jgi:glycine oxidase
MVLFHGTRRPFSHVLNEGPRYLVPRDDGYVLAGSTEEEVGFDKKTTPEGLSDLTRFAYDLVPDLRGFEAERTWAGLRPGSFDGFPYIGAIPGLDNAFAAAGHFRSGLHLSTGTAVVLAELIRGLPPQVDLSPFHVGRG